MILIRDPDIDLVRRLVWATPVYMSRPNIPRSPSVSIDDSTAPRPDDGLPPPLRKPAILEKSSSSRGSFRVVNGPDIKAVTQRDEQDDGAAPEEHSTRRARKIEVLSADALYEARSPIMLLFLQHALERLGSPNPVEEAEVLQKRLGSELHVHTALQLSTSLSKSQPSDSRSQAEMRAFLRENLFRALQDEVTAFLPSVAQFIPMQKPRRVRLQITRVDVLQVSNISQKSQCFDMELFVQVG